MTTYRTPDHRRNAVRQAVNALRASRNAVLTTHVNADGDGTGSQIALAAWLRALGGRAWIINPTPFPDMFRFMLPESSWVVEAGSERARELCARADLAVVLDTGEFPRIGRVKPMIQDLRALVIDHHPPGEKPIGGLSLRDPAACATGELVHDLVLATDGPWEPAVRTGIYVGILTDTGSFRFSNSTPASHRIAADLIERGLDPEAVSEEVYGASPLRRFQLLQACLSTLEADPDGGVAWMRVPRDVYEQLGATPDDLEGLVEYPRAVEGTEVAMLFRQTSRGDTKVSFRATGDVDVNQLARTFGGGGHVKASGALLERTPDEVVPEVVDAAREAVRGHRAAGPPGNPEPRSDVVEG